MWSHLFDDCRRTCLWGCKFLMTTVEEHVSGVVSFLDLFFFLPLSRKLGDILLNKLLLHFCL